MNVAKEGFAPDTNAVVAMLVELSPAAGVGACGFPVNTVREIEAGRLCPTPQMLDVLNKVLKAKLKYNTAV